MQREPTRITLTKADITDMINSLEAQKFHEQMRASRSKDNDRKGRATLENSNIFGIRPMEQFNTKLEGITNDFYKHLPHESESFVSHISNVAMDITHLPDIHNEHRNRQAISSEVNPIGGTNRNLISSHGSHTDNNDTNRSSLSVHPIQSERIEDNNDINYRRNFSASSNISNNQPMMDEEMSTEYEEGNPFYRPE
ncbi:hypothetical protein C6P45_003879 [Maudiozyma exigua]|uniref:Uncharacterized protein n=1 Tax=Maudiozyma exigua TaxID=34358 RepID=A0A9P6WDG4_MAUEX|nr:hypothetical protein C6P45_003879 [Kazachstania exigua]